MKKPEIFRQTVRIRAVAQISRFIATACAAIAVCLALNAHAVNILVNPGFDATPGFNGWSAHTTESWSYATHTDVPLSAPNYLWQQGLYGNGGAPNSGYVSYCYQTFPTAPGSGYTADAHFSQYVRFFGAPGQVTEGGDDINASTNASGATGLYNLNDAFSGYWEDGFVEVVFLNAASNGTNDGGGANIVADYKSVIIDRNFESAITNNVTYLVTNSVNIYYPTVVTNVILNWIDVAVTNQYDRTTLAANQDPSANNPYPHTPATTGTVTNRLALGSPMVAPAGAAYVQFRLCLYQLSYASGAPHWDDCSLNQVSGYQPDVISAITPSAGVFLTNTSFSFNVMTPNAGITTPTNSIKVVVNGVNESSSLLFSGNNTNWNVTLPGLVSNTIYNISIAATNTAGLLTAAGSSFDTFSSNNFVVYSEDYDYSSGLFIQNPVPSTNAGPSSYWGLLGVSNIDYAINSGGGTYGGGNNQLPNYPNRNLDTAWQIPSDPQTPLYASLGAPTSGVYNVTIAYNNGGPAGTGGQWYNYTRTYPSGNYLLYARISSGNSTLPAAELLNLQTSGHGTAGWTITNIGQFAATINNDWNTYYWYPLTSDGNPNNFVVVNANNLPAGQQTLQLMSLGDCNVSYFVFVPVPAIGLPPTIRNLTPASLTAVGGGVFVSASSISFTTSSLFNTISTNDIHSYLNGVSIPETFSGNSTNWVVTFPVSLPANLQNQTFFITVKDSNGLTNSVSGTFDTFSQNNFMIEAEDFDFNSGQYIDNPVPTSGNGTTTGNLGANSYFYWAGGSSLNVSTPGVDLTTSNDVAGETFAYRGLDGCGTEITSDYLRNKFVIAGATNVDFDVGWWVPGTWLNYTRTIPTNTYLVYGRLASGGAYTNATMDLVTLGQGTPSQTTTPLGTFSDPNANGFQSWHWIPLLAANGQPAVVSLGGVDTLKVTAAPAAGNITGVMNANFYMFVPYTAVTPYSISASVSAGVVSIKFPTQSGHSYTVQYSTSLNPTNWQTLSGASNIAGTGGTVTATDSTTGGAVRFYRVAAN